MQNAFKNIFQWFSGNQIKGNTEKYHPLHNATNNISLSVENGKINYIITK